MYCNMLYTCIVNTSTYYSRLELVKRINVGLT